MVCKQTIAGQRMAMPGSRICIAMAPSERSPAWRMSGASSSPLGHVNMPCRAMDVHKARGSAIADAAIRRIARLYAVEKAVRDLPPDKRAEIPGRPGPDPSSTA